MLLLLHLSKAASLTDDGGEARRGEEKKTGDGREKEQEKEDKRIRVGKDMRAGHWRKESR